MHRAGRLVELHRIHRAGRLMELHRYRLRGITAEMRENMIQKSIRELVRYGLATGLVEPEDTSLRMRIRRLQPTKAKKHS